MFFICTSIRQMHTLAAYRANYGNDEFIAFFQFNYIPGFQFLTDPQRLFVLLWLDVVLRRHSKQGPASGRRRHLYMKSHYNFASACLSIWKAHSAGATRKPRFPTRQSYEQLLSDIYTHDSSFPTKSDIASVLEDLHRLGREYRI